MPIGITFFMLHRCWREPFVSSSIPEEILWPWTSVPREDLISDTEAEQWEKERASKNINKVGDARGLCEEQMASGCKHTSTFISREARWGDVLFSLLTIYCLLKIFPLCLSVRFACVFLQFWIYFFSWGGCYMAGSPRQKKPKTATTKHKQIWSTVDDVHFSNLLFFFFLQCVNYRNKVPSFVVSSWAYSGPSL